MVLPHMVSHMVGHMVSPVVGLQKGPSCCPTALPTALLGGATAASLLLFERGQNCRTCSGDCGPVWFLCRGDTTVERALGLWSCLVSLQRGQNLRTCSGDCGPVWFLCRGNRTVERALGTVVLSGFSKEGTELWNM